LREQLDDTPVADAAGRQHLIEEIDRHYRTSRDQFAKAIAIPDLPDAARCWQEMCFLSKLIEAAQPQGD